MYCTKKVTEDVIWLGGNDRRLALFEGVYPIDRGVAYNSYLLLDEKTALMDTADKAVAGLFLENLEHALGGRPLDYMVVQHMEPDHAAMLEAVLTRHPEATVVCSAKALTFIGQFFGPKLTEKAKVIKEGDTLELGHHTLSFIGAPMVHWPEVMMTYDAADRILFSADGFGTFGSQDGALFADEVDFDRDYLDAARWYYTNIVGKYGPQVQAVLKKAAGADIAMICPLHGFVWRKDLGYILDRYDKWSSYTPEEDGVLIAYASIYGHTENAAEVLAAALRRRGVKTRLYDCSVSHKSVVLSECFRYSRLVFASATYNAGIYTPMKELLEALAEHNLQNRTVGLMENGSWGPMAAKQMAGILEGMKNMTVLEPVVTMKSALTEEQLPQVEALADALSAGLHIEAKEEKTGSVPEKGETPMIDTSVYRDLTYGLFILSANDGTKDTGCIINTVCQAASDPQIITIAVNKANYTHDVIAKTGIFNVSILAEDAPFGLFQHFGFQSGRDVNKYENCTMSRTSANGCRYHFEHTCGFISGKVISSMDLGSHTLFVAEVTEAGKTGSGAPITYAYYHANTKPKPKKEEQKKKGFICNICGYIYEGDELPADFICPICKHPASDFSPLE